MKKAIPSRDKFQGKKFVATKKAEEEEVTRKAHPWNTNFTHHYTPIVSENDIDAILMDMERDRRKSR